VILLMELDFGSQPRDAVPRTSLFQAESVENLVGYPTESWKAEEKLGKGCAQKKDQNAQP